MLHIFKGIGSKVLRKSILKNYIVKVKKENKRKNKSNNLTEGGKKEIIKSPRRITGLFTHRRR
jgi:phenylalanyl-tRNA synthetase beta subunit